MKVVVLGGSGFIGRALGKHLERAGHAVVAPSSATVQVQTRATLATVFDDLQPDCVINLAGVASVSSSDALGYYQVNAFGHLNVLDAMAEVRPGARVLLASSANVYGKGKRAPLCESDRPAPINHYGLSKLMAEEFGRLYSDRLQICAVRIFNCIGLGQAPTFLVPKIVYAFKARQERLNLGNLSVERDFVDLRDVCEMWRLLVESPTAPEAINFGSGSTATIETLIALLADLTGHRPLVESVPALQRPHDIEYQCADISCLSRLGFSRRVSLNETLKWMLGEADQ